MSDSGEKEKEGRQYLGVWINLNFNWEQQMFVLDFPMPFVQRR